MKNTTPDPVCSVCADGLCENHEQDCWGDAIFGLFGGRCACPNQSE